MTIMTCIYNTRDCSKPSSLVVPGPYIPAFLCPFEVLHAEMSACNIEKLGMGLGIECRLTLQWLDLRILILFSQPLSN